ncbi:ripening-related protein 4 [Canna indica]|uniref:Ripening-related protein 4 n=1 Tax=Canna indica TaxID=4628 RepID=A0AAQ3K0V5_9LILI|nr:ripening-related protein 4 [Canna indica]
MDGDMYPQYKCSPLVTAATPTDMMLVSFVADGDGGGPTECDGKYHVDDQMLVALSTRCLVEARILGGVGRQVRQPDPLGCTKQIKEWKLKRALYRWEIRKEKVERS